MKKIIMGYSVIDKAYIDKLIAYKKDDRIKVKKKMEKRGYKLVLQPTAPIKQYIASLQVYVAPDYQYFVIPFAGYNGKGYLEYPFDENNENVDVFCVIHEIACLYKNIALKKQALSILLDCEHQAGRDDVVAELLLIGHHELFRKKDDE